MEVCEQPNEIWVGPFVIDKKSSVYAKTFAFKGHIHRVGMPTEIAPRFKNAQLVSIIECKGAT